MTSPRFQQQHTQNHGARAHQQNTWTNNASPNAHQSRQAWLKQRRLELVLQQEEVLAALEGLDHEWATWRQATMQLYQSKPSVLSQVALPVLANVMHMRQILPFFPNLARIWYHRYQALQAEDIRLMQRTHQLHTQLDTIVRKLHLIDAEIF
jgi:hypothetical protein